MAAVARGNGFRWPPFVPVNLPGLPPRTHNSSMPIRVVCFDVGGVLIRIARTWEEVVRRAFGDARAEAFAGHVFESCPSFAAYQRGELDEDAYLPELAAYLGCECHEALALHNGILIEEFPGVFEVVQSLNRSGVATACLSNTNAPHWAAMLETERFPALRALQHPCASHEMGLEKPDPTIYRAFEARLGVAGEEILFFDDTVINVEAARSVGWHAVAIDPFGDPAAQMRAELTARHLLNVQKTA